MSDDVKNAEFSPMTESVPPEGVPRATLDLVAEIPIRVSAELGHARLPIKELLNLGPGSVVELDRLAGESIDLVVNGVLVGRGDVVIVNENFAVRITEIVHPEERLNSLKE